MLATMPEPSPGRDNALLHAPMAAASVISPTTVHRIRREHKLEPHQIRSFKFSNDPQLGRR